MVDEIKIDKRGISLPSSTQPKRAKSELPKGSSEEGIKISSHLDAMSHLMAEEENNQIASTQRLEEVKTQINNRSFKIDLNLLANKLLKVFNLA